MCEYCMPLGKLLTTDNASDQAYIRQGIGIGSYYIYHRTGVGYKTMIYIKYCPMCGRKLEVEE